MFENELVKYAGAFNYVVVVLITLAVISPFAMKFPQIVWKFLTVVPGVVVAVWGGYLIIAALGVGGTPAVAGPQVIATLAAGVWSGMWAVWYLSNRKTA